jgi:hypothetical protein
MAKFTRGSTAKTTHSSQTRPPAVKGGVSNDFLPPKTRSAVMPPPTKDTQEPRMSRKSPPRGK